MMTVWLGPTEKLESPRKSVEPLVKYCDSLMLTRGIQRSCIDPRYLVPIVLRVSGAVLSLVVTITGDVESERNCSVPDAGFQYNL